MANPRNPNDPYRSPDDPDLAPGESYRSADDPYRTRRADSDIRRPSQLDSELQPDPELAEGPANGGKIAMFAIAIALVLGAVFYGLNNSSVNHAGTASTAQNTAAPTSPPAAPPGMRDVTPRANNSEPGATTGAAPARPAPPAPAPAANPPANNPAPK